MHEKIKCFETVVVPAFCTLHPFVDACFIAGMMIGIEAHESSFVREPHVKHIATARRIGEHDAHAVAHVVKLAPRLKRNQIVVVNLSGRGDKDVMQVAKIRGVNL